MKAVVTGGAGFIGSHLAERLLQDGHEVHVLDDLSLGRRANVPAQAVFHHGSVLDARRVGEALAGADAVFHEAALPSVPRSLEAPLASHEANATGTLQILEAARRLDVAKVVYAASSSAYGNTATLPKVEAMPAAPRSPYAAAKLAGEMYCAAYAAAYGVRTVCLRYFNVYGPRQDPEGAYAAVIPRFILAALQGRPLPIHGDGAQTRDFTYVADAVEANLLAWRAPAGDGQPINVGAGERTDLNTLAAHILRLTGSASPVVHGPARPGDVRDSLAGLDRARGLLGYRPRVRLSEGIAETVAWFRGLANR